MDDLKLYTSSEKDLKALIKKIRQFSNDIGMRFGMDKCAKCIMKKGRKVEASNITLDDGEKFKELDGSMRIFFGYFVLTNFSPSCATLNSILNLSMEMKDNEHYKVILS